MTDPTAAGEGEFRLAAFAQERLARHRALMLLGLSIGLGGVLAWLPPEARTALLGSLIVNRWLAALLGLFVLVTLSLLWSAGQRVDAWAFRAFNAIGRRPAWLDGMMWGLTQLGNMGVALVGATALFFAGERRLAAEITLGLFTLWQAVELIKALTDRARPFVLLAETRVVGWRAVGLSFPSGHTAQCFLLAGLLIQHLRPSTMMAAGLFALAGLVGLTRVYVGAHYPRDVLAGAFLGLPWSMLVRAVSEHIPPLLP